MQPQDFKNCKKQNGAVMAEYAIALSILSVVFITVGVVLYKAIFIRARASVGVVETIIPCYSSNDGGGNTGKLENSHNSNECK